MHSEYLGVFGLSWQEKIAARMYKILGSDYASIMKDFYQSGGYNINLVNTLYNAYILYGSKDATKTVIAEKSGESETVAQAFLIALKDAAISGEISSKYYDPDTFSKASSRKEALLTPTPVKQARSYLTIAAVIVGGILAMQVLSYLPKGASRS